MTQEPSVGIPQWTAGDRLGKSLDYADMSVQEMADYLEVSRNTVGNYINDRTRIPRPTFKLWAMRTGVSPEWLEHGEAAGTPSPPDGGVRNTDKLERLTEAKRGRTRATRRAAVTDGYLTAA